MSYWEKNTLILGLGSLLGGSFYFAFVLWQSLALGALAAPSLYVWLGYIVFQFGISTAGALLMANRSELADLKTFPGATDERDTLIRTRAEAGQGHVASIFVFISMAAWFVHVSAAILFHSLVAALVLSELFRCGLQLFSYRRGV